MLYLTVMLLFLLFAAVAMTVNEGLWSNTIALFNILLAGILAIFAGVPFGNFLLAQSGKPAELAWYFVFAGIWGTFALSVTVMHLATKAASDVRMRFVPLLDKIAGPLMGILVAVMLTSFTAYTLERVPIKAGEWSFGDASEWQQTTFKYARAPFRGVLKSFVQGEKADHPFLGS
ncbi:MAG: CvpA family protein [Planctomycetales bacterium]|nr:CvpA family protein [Planctomycetales bacterium]